MREWKTCCMARLLNRKASAFVLLRWEKSISSSAAAARTARWMAASTRLLPLSTRETVAMLTFAAAAISRRPTLPFLRGLSFMRQRPSISSIAYRDLRGFDPQARHDNTEKFPGEQSPRASPDAIPGTHNLPAKARISGRSLPIMRLYSIGYPMSEVLALGLRNIRNLA